MDYKIESPRAAQLAIATASGTGVAAETTALDVGVTVKTFQFEPGRERKEYRDAIVVQVLNGMASNLSSTIDNATTKIQQFLIDRFGDKAHQLVGKVAGQSADVGPDGVSAFIPGVTPVAVGATFYKIRQAAYEAHHEPSHLKECRAKMLLGIADVSAFIYSVSSLSSPVGLIASTIISNGVKIANAIHNVVRGGEYREDRDYLIQSAARWSEKPGVKQALNFLLGLTYKLDHSVVTGVDSLRENFAPTASEQKVRQGEVLLQKFHKLYSNYYPAAQTEKQEAMRSYLADQNDTWDIHILEKDGKVMGGFTGFQQIDPTFGKHLYVEQILPPYAQDPVGNLTTWKHIMDVAAQMGAKRVWLESPRSEMLPQGFQELNILHAQPSLTGRANGPVGIEAENPAEQLRMSFRSVSETEKPPTYKEYYDVITIGCTSPWADVNDPAWKMILQNPRTMDLIPLVPRESEAAISIGEAVASTTETPQPQRPTRHAA